MPRTQRRPFPRPNVGALTLAPLSSCLPSFSLSYWVERQFAVDRALTQRDAAFWLTLLPSYQSPVRIHG
jgi:hypothetical protein